MRRRRRDEPEAELTPDDVDTSTDLEPIEDENPTDVGLDFSGLEEAGLTGFDEAAGHEPTQKHRQVISHARPGPGRGDRLRGMTRGGLSGMAAAAFARAPRVWAWLVPRLARLAITSAAGLLFYASFPTVNWWWSAVVAFALLAWVLTRPATTPKGGLGYGFLFGLWFYLPLLPWISLLVGDMPWVVLAITCSLFPALFGLCAVVVRRIPGWPVWFAIVWVAQEWLKSVFPFGGFPWGSVAFGQTEGPLLPLVQLGGTALLSLAIVLIGCSFTAIVLEIAAWWRSGSKARAGAQPAVLLPGLSICLVLLAAIVVWPHVRQAGTGSGGEPGITVAAIQGNVPRLGLEFNAQRRGVLDNHVRETMRLAEEVRAGTAPQPAFVIWPEDASDIDPLLNADAGQQISEAAAAIRAPILVGTILDVPGRMQETQEFTNTVIVWNPGSGPADRHDKEIVQPFGEYLPMRWLFTHLSSYAGRAGHIVPRPSSDVVRVGGTPVGVSTCWEVIFDREPRKAVLNGAQLLAVPSNNATFNQTMSEQQLAFAKVRAVEHDRYVIVAGTTGISAVIAPDGGELARTEFFAPAYLDTQVRLKTGLTPATRWAPMLQLLLVAAAGAVIFLGIRQNGFSPRLVRRLPFRRKSSLDEPEEPGSPPRDDEESSGSGRGHTGHSEKGDFDDEDAAAPDDEGDDDMPPGPAPRTGGHGPARHSGRHRGAT
jgi:apolipoprotein N-acyltransferase